MDEKTISYYDKNAEYFVQGTQNVEFTKVQDHFLALLPHDGRILDFGCGSGRDAKYFLNKGFQTDAIDGSVELCKLAGEYTGIDVKHMFFSEFDACDLYDGIWACASVLHLPKGELKDIFSKMIRALKDRGYIYTSFKYGDFEGYRNERYFTDFTEAAFRQFIGKIPGIKMKECWLSDDVRPDRNEEKWLNIILQKQIIN